MKKILLALMVTLAVGSAQGRWGSDRVVGMSQSLYSTAMSNRALTLSALGGAGVLLYMFRSVLTREAKTQYKNLQKRLQHSNEETA